MKSTKAHRRAAVRALFGPTWKRTEICRDYVAWGENGTATLRMTLDRQVRVIAAAERRGLRAGRRGG